MTQTEKANGAWECLLRVRRSYQEMCTRQICSNPLPIWIVLLIGFNCLTFLCALLRFDLFPLQAHRFLIIYDALAATVILCGRLRCGKTPSSPTAPKWKLLAPTTLMHPVHVVGLGIARRPRTCSVSGRTTPTRSATMSWACRSTASRALAAAGDQTADAKVYTETSTTAKFRIARQLNQ
ncbi:hypothetical protein BIW11_14105 [Tropilaelaps mercedesae]|uniref:Uncharacterized protein n=1 Tax=Tropilaelaps mercedesae TaxID=418985 RepID=A0A1V9WZ11_9ACAR|nr:hypothetical protein BIW11_14105 [Tropilaelaps mercedesae]